MTDYCCERMAEDLNQVCDQHRVRFDCPDLLIAEVRGGFGIIVHDGTDDVIKISFCPWCGSKLPPIGEIDLSSLPTDTANPAD